MGEEEGGEEVKGLTGLTGGPGETSREPCLDTRRDTTTSIQDSSSVEAWTE